LLRAELVANHIEANLVAADRPTTTKTRVLGGSQQILRIDRELREDIASDARTELLEWATGALDAVDALLISDYGKGVATKEVCGRLIQAARGRGKPVIVDPKGRDYSKYQGATVVTPNVAELASAVEMLRRYSGDLDEDVSILRSVLPETAIVVTRGPDGVVLCEVDGSVVTIRSRARSVFDVTGAGDTFAATLALGLAVGASFVDAATIANAAAGLSVRAVGTRAVERQELVTELTANRSDESPQLEQPSTNG
jgi:D-beta-D-heptose 7-phosphate kinase/D-beta-D-heptose 1-phosphate adenosyltransferase